MRMVMELLWQRQGVNKSPWANGAKGLDENFNIPDVCIIAAFLTLVQVSYIFCILYIVW
jgi:hypothetical protein